ncbi:hypothetical protein UPYG_G00302820 [Umbra pygmaea]|uniref:FYVE-type domain-containing protein n=1 Tax=Umbra pygmaea TaxID=75934 RepID=A0ABD0WB22_UMBPY
MENYFQAEAFNLDKVLDDFEQNQDDDTGSPTLSDAKWSQILAPPTHLLSLNPALALSPDLSPSPRDGGSPVSFKTFLNTDPSSNSSAGPEPKNRPAADLLLGGEEEADRPPDVHSPLLPQANIGKLVGGEEGPSHPASASSSPAPYYQPTLENGCPSTNSPSPDRPSLNGHTDASCSNQQRSPLSTPLDHDSAVEGWSGYLSQEDRLGGGQVAQEASTSLETEISGAGKPTQDGGGGQEGGGQEGGGQEGGKSSAVEHQERRENGTQQGGVMAGGLGERQGDLRKTSQEVGRGPGETEVQSWGGEEGDIFNGLETDEGGETGSREEGQCPTTPSSKEDSVMEEKELEESKQENEGGAERGGTGSAPSKLNNSRLQPVSVPFGGARPKQPVCLKLQIPRTLSGQVHNQLASSNTGGTPAPTGGKNKNLDSQCRVAPDSASVVPGGHPAGGGGVFVNGELLNRQSLSSLSDLGGDAESSPDNDLQAGQHRQGALPRKQPTTLGEVAPVWVPDSQAPSCMKCEARFTFTKRRHHCRACGKVFCAACCGLKSRLVYMDMKEARVCVTCHSALLAAHSWQGTCGVLTQNPNPNNPSEYCSTISPLLQVQGLASAPPTVMVPVGVLKTSGPEGSTGSLPREQRRVWFADGILPNGETADPILPNGDAAESPKRPDASAAPAHPLAVSQRVPKSDSTADWSEVCHTEHMVTK